MPERLSSNPIGIFDSGIGGIAIATKVRELMPHEDIVYVADSLHAPYGEKPKEFILERATHITEFLLSKQAKAIVVACNTATMTAIQTLRDNYDIPFIGVEPGVKPAALKTHTGVIGVLATSQTLVSDAFSKLAERTASHVDIQIQACPDWVELIENMDLTSPQAKQKVEQYVRPLLDKGADTLILGCTHFTHIKTLIQQISGSDINIISTEMAVAKQTLKRLEDEHLTTSQLTNGNSLYVSNGNLDIFHQQIDTCGPSDNGRVTSF